MLFKKKTLKVNVTTANREGKVRTAKVGHVSDAKIRKIEKEQERRQKIEAQYKPTLEKHFALIEEIKHDYSAALKKGFDTLAMNRVVSLCKKDIALSEKIKEYCRKIGDPLYTLPAYERLAIIYEKRGEINKALSVCKASVRIGNQPEEFKERIKRLEAKQ